MLDIHVVGAPKRGSCLLIKGVIVEKIPGKGLWLGWL